MEPDSDFFKHLPPEITTNILLRPSVRTIALSKCVCKSWLKLLESDDFVTSHFAQSAPALAPSMRSEDSNRFKFFELDEDELNSDLDHEENHLACFDFPHKASIGGSANGLLFLNELSRDHSISYVCNPITREFIALPSLGGTTFCGFGVSRISSQHKAVCIYPRCEGDLKFLCHVYTLGTGSWRLVEAAESFFWCLTMVGTFVRGNLHWMVSDLGSAGIERVSCLDLETERFRSFTVPRPLVGFFHLTRRLYALRDSLAFCEGASDGVGVGIWMMKEYGVEKSWSKEYVIAISPGRDSSRFKRFHPITVYENGDVLLWFEKRFYYYSKEKESSREIRGLFGAGKELVGAEKREFEFHCEYMVPLLHTPSMASLKCFGGRENVISF